MTDNEKRYKAAFMNLLANYEAHMQEGISIEAFCEVCPLQKDIWGGCSKGLLDEDYDGNTTCAEEIFNWYLENDND